MKYERNVDVTLDDSVTTVLKNVRPGSRVLEFGPAAGYMTKYMKEELGCRVSCVEVDPASAAAAQPYAERMVTADLDSLTWTLEFPPESFDHLVFADVLEHLKDPWKVLKEAVRFLKKGGTVLTSIPNVGHMGVSLEIIQGRFDYRTLGILDNTHLRFFTRRSVLHLLEQASLGPVEAFHTYRVPQATEFENKAADFPKPIIDLITANPDALVYQFIHVSRRKEELEGAQVVTEQGPPADNPSFAAQLFYDTGSGFRAEDSISIAVEARTGPVTWMFPGLPPVSAAFRFDPADRPIAIILKSIKMRRRPGDNPVELRRGSSHTGLKLAEDRFVFLDDDPHILLEDDASGNAESLEVELEILAIGAEAVLALVNEEIKRLREGGGSSVGTQSDLNYFRKAISPDRTIWKRTLNRAVRGLKAVRRRAVASAGKLFGNERMGTQAYSRWMDRHDRLTSEDRSAIRARVEGLSYKPLISVLMPVHDPPEDRLREAVDSVRRQLYPYWELCIASDAAPGSAARVFLEEAQKSEPRIRATFPAPGTHDSATIGNAALRLSSGEFVAPLGSGDELAEHALYMVAEELNSYPVADLIYTDEDQIDETGKRSSPQFKPEWSPDLLMSRDYIGQSVIYRSALVQSLEGFREGFKGSHGYDLCLRCVERSRPERIRHIPFVLYHNRISDSPPNALQDSADSDSSALRALSDHAQKLPLKPHVSIGLKPATYRFEYPLPQNPPLVTLIVPTRDNHVVLRKFLTGLLEKTTYPRFEILVVDNQSRDAETLRHLDELGHDNRIRVIRYDAPFNFSAINNFAVRHARGEVLVFANDDMEVISSEWLEEMVSQALRPEIGAVGAKLLYPDGRLQHGGVVLGIGGVAGHSHKYSSGTDDGYFWRPWLVHNVSAVTAACLAVRRLVFQEAGGFDEQRLSVAFNDVDLCLKIRENGYRLLWTPYACLYHHESLSRGSESSSPEKQARFEKEAQHMIAKWRDLLLHDPFYSPNLTLQSEDFSLAWPPRSVKPWLKAASSAKASDPKITGGIGAVTYRADS